MLRLTESEEEDYWQKLEIGKNFNAAPDKLMKLKNRENGTHHQSSPDENNNNVNNHPNHHHRSNSSLVVEDDDVVLENSNNSLLIVSEIPSTVFNYPRRIILGLCLKLRRKQIFQFRSMESNMISFSSSSSSSSSSKSSPSKCNNNNSSCNCNCNCRGDLPGNNNHSTSTFEGETSNLKFRRRKTPTSTTTKITKQSTENMMTTSLTLEKNTIGRLKLENVGCLVENPCCKNSQKTTTNRHSPDLLSSENSCNKPLSHSHHRMSSPPPSPSLWFTSKSNNETGSGPGSGIGATGTGGLRTMRRVGLGFRHGGTGLWRTLFLVLFYLLILLDSSVGCGPGRGAGRRRAPRKLTPLVYKQHVPNVPENTLSASGLNEGKINRDHPRFKALVPNYNTDIIFRDDEGTGADRLMSQRCKEKLNTLAISVMNQWPGVRLRVIEGWDEGNHHSTSSLHYEGRAVDITTSDKDRSKYGMLARLAVEAGFDWVYYESRAHIHCSVKSDSSQAARSGGCFSENATVVTTEGRRKITEVRPGDSVLSVNDRGETVFSEVVMFLDRNSTETREFYHVTTSSGASIALTPSHLIFKMDRVIGDNLLKTKNSDSKSIISNSIDSNLEILSSEQLLTSAQVTFAKNIEAGDWLLVVSQSSSEFKSSSADGEKREILQLEKVVHMEARMSTGVYAPLTKQGNVIVDNVLASCYAVVNDQSLAHWAFSPVRFVVNVYEAIGHAWRQFSRLVTFRPVHVHSHSQPHPQIDDFHQNPMTAPFTKVISHKELPAIAASRADESNNLPSAKKISEQGVHWYASFLYSTSYYLIPSHLLYESS